MPNDYDHSRSAPTRLSRRTVIAGALSTAAAGTLMSPSIAWGSLGRTGAAGMAAAAWPLPQTRDHGVARWQVFDSNIPDASVMYDKVQFVWHNSVTTDADLPIGVSETGYRMLGSGYIAGDLNWPLGRDFPAYTVDWFRQNGRAHFIHYKDDRTTVAWRVATAPGEGDPQPIPLDMANPEVRQWMVEKNVMPALTQSWDPSAPPNHRVLAVDLVQLFNVLNKGGHFDPTDTVWTQQFKEGDFSILNDPEDQAYADWWLDWLGWLRDWLHARGYALALNLGDNQWQCNHLRSNQVPVVPASVLAAQKAAIDIADIWVSEFVVLPERKVRNADGTWRTVDMNVGQAWVDQLELTWHYTSQGKPFCAATYLPQKLADSPINEIEWAIAYYYLYKGPGTMLALCGKNLETTPVIRENGSWVDHEAFQQADIGAATTGPVERGSGVWSRQYTEGIAAVNPSATDAKPITLPPDYGWMDLSGTTHRDAVTIPPKTGYVMRKV